MRLRRIQVGAALAALIFIVGANAARAEIQKSGPENFPGKTELTANLGFQAGFGAAVGNASGFKLEAEYAYRFHPYAWFDARVGNVFGFGPTEGLCLDGISQCYRGGWDLELSAGIKLKFRTAIPLVVEIPFLLGVDVLYNRECGDDGAAVPVFRTGGSVYYFLTRHVGVGGGLSVGLGPGFHTGSPCRAGGAYADFYGVFNFLVGAEFIL